MAPSKGPL